MYFFLTRRDATEIYSNEHTRARHGAVRICLLGRRVDGAGPAAGGAGLAQALDEGLHLALRLGTLEAVDQLSLVEGINRRERLDAELRGELLVLVDVDIPHAPGPGAGLHATPQDGPLPRARPTPRRPNMHNTPPP